MGFGPPARRSHYRNDRDFVYDHRRILHENGIRKFRLGWERHDLNTQLCEAISIRFVLSNCFGNINRLTRMKRQLAIIDASAHLASDCRQHLNYESATCARLSVNSWLLNYVPHVERWRTVSINFFHQTIFDPTDFFGRLLGANVVFTDVEHHVLNKLEGVIQH